MPTVKTDNEISDRLLTIDWGQPASERQPAVAYTPTSTKVRVRIDEVFAHINAYRAIVESGISQDGLLAQSLISQANAIFNQAFLNLQSRHGFEAVFADVGMEAGMDDITDLVINEVLALQNIVHAR